MSFSLTAEGLIALALGGALARALALAPSILLMDEPLSTLDDELNKQLREEILRLHSDLGFTLVYVTHSRDEAAQIGSRTIHLRQGRTDTAYSDANHIAC
jgi:ABC-type sulfate/molybdate transport systems ATPase subunit